MRRYILPALLVLSATSATTAFADDAKRQLGAHVHGHGELNIAIDGQRVSMELKAPGSDIVGFEHAAKSKKQKAALANARKVLSDPLKLFQPSSEAGCKTTKAEVEWEIEGGDGKKHDHGHKHSHDHGHNHKSEKGETHAEFQATYILNCSAAAKLTKLDFPFFKAFPRAKKLTVQILGPKGQSKHQASRKSRSISF